MNFFKRTSHAVLACVIATLLSTSAISSEPVEPQPQFQALHTVTVKSEPTLAASSPSNVEVGEKFFLRGTVAVSKKNRVRKVILREKAGKKWRKISTVKTNKRGKYSFKVKAGSTAKTRVFRVKAPKVKGLKAVKARVSVKVEKPKASPNTGNDPKDWSLLFPDGARWNPCEPITWSYTGVNSAYGTTRADLAKAFTRVSAETGFVFEPAADNSIADIDVSWSNEKNDTYLKGNVVGYAIAYVTPVKNANVQYRITRAKLVLDNGENLRPGHYTFGASSWGQVITHEIIHGMGLNHANGEDQIMYSGVSSLNHNFGAGDKAGLKHVSTGGCLS